LSVLAYLRWPLAEDPALHFAGVHQALTSGRGLGEDPSTVQMRVNYYQSIISRLSGTPGSNLGC